MSGAVSTIFRENPKIQNEALSVLTLISVILRGADTDTITDKIDHMMPVYGSEHMIFNDIPVFAALKIQDILIICYNTVVQKIGKVDIPKFVDPQDRDFLNLNALHGDPP
jgi:hypothetical protein